MSRTLLQAGDTVMVEEPGWAVEFARLQLLGMRILPIPRRAEGPDLAVMARYCKAYTGTPRRPKLFVSVSVLHNPTGYSLPPGSAHRVLQLANEHDFHIVEDDTYSHITPNTPRCCVRWTVCNARFTSVVLPKYLPPTGASAIWQRRPAWQSGC